MSLRSAALALTVGLVTLVGAACGDPNAEPAAGAPAASSPATEAATASTTAETPAPTAPMPGTLVPPPTIDATATTIAGAPGDGPRLDGLSADDPFPAQADAAGDPDTAITAIAWAFRHWIIVDLPADVRARIIENGEANTERIEAGIDQAEGLIHAAGIEVDEVNFTGVDSAEVVFRITWQGEPSPIFPDPMTGTAVYADGSWRLAGRTLCLLAVGIGQECGAETPRLAPLALRVSGLPADAVQTSEFDASGNEIAPIPGVVPVPGVATWWPAGEQPYMESGPLLGIATYVLPDVASRSEADLAVVIRARWGSDGPIESVAGGRGRTEDADGYVRVLVVRPDDVIVDARSAVLSLDELVAIVAGLEPTELPA